MLAYLRSQLAMMEKGADPQGIRLSAWVIFCSVETPSGLHIESDGADLYGWCFELLEVVLNEVQEDGPKPFSRDSANRHHQRVDKELDYNGDIRVHVEFKSSTIFNMFAPNILSMSTEIGGVLPRITGHETGAKAIIFKVGQASKEICCLAAVQQRRSLTKAMVSGSSSLLQVRAFHNLI